MILLRSAARSPLFTAYASYGFRFGNKQVVYIARQSAILFYQFCLSVRLSNAGIVCKQVDISSHFLLTFWRHSSFSTPPPYRRCKIPRRTPLSGGVKCTGVGKLCQYWPLSGKRYEIGPWLLWNTHRKSQVADRSVSVPMTFSDLERRDVKGQHFLEDLHNYARTV